MNTAAKGRRKEWKVREELEGKGFSVTRSAASKGTFDLVAIGAETIILIQSKTNGWPDPAERAKIEAFVCPRNAIKHIWRFDDRQPPRILQFSAEEGAWFENGKHVLDEQCTRETHFPPQPFLSQYDFADSKKPAA